jgi:hypothetical protein
MEAYGIVRGYLPALDVLYDVFRATGRAEDQLGVGDLILGAAASDPTGVSPFLSSARLDEIRRGVEEIRRSTAGGPRRELEVESELERALEREPERGLEGESEREPGREPEGESEREPGREPEREPEGESEREPEREPEGESEREPEREPQQVP